MGENNELRLGVVVWRKVELDDSGLPTKLAKVEPRINENTGDLCFRINLDGVEPELVSGHERGIVAICKKEPPENWTHVTINGFSRDGNCVFLWFSFDENVHTYLTFRRALAREQECPEDITYAHMDRGFRRIQKGGQGVRYV